MFSSLVSIVLLAHFTVLHSGGIESYHPALFFMCLKHVVGSLYAYFIYFVATP